MEDNEEEDLLVVKRAIPESPLEDPLAIDSSLLEVSGEIINLDTSSDEETEVITNKTLTNREIIKMNLLKRILTAKRQENPSECDVVDVDADDADPLAPLRSVLKPIEPSEKVAILNSNLEAPPSYSSIQGMSQVIRQIPQHVGYSGSNFDGIETNKKPIRKSVAKRQTCNMGPRRTKRVRQQTNIKKVIRPQVVGVVQHPVNSTSSNSVSSLNDVNNIAEQIRMSGGEARTEDFETDIPVQRFILYKPYQSNNAAESQHSQAQNKSSSGIGVNVNICTASTPTTSATSDIISNSQFQKGNSHYNVELGLVLNVNETSTSSPGSSRKQIGLNNVALDVSVNMNKKDDQEKQVSNKDSSDLEYLPTEGDFNHYMCFCCTYKTAEPTVMKEHSCLNQMPTAMQHTLAIQHSIYRIIQITKKSNVVEKNLTYKCSFCSMKSADLELLKTHECDHSYKAGILAKSIYRDVTMYTCGLCPLKFKKYFAYRDHICEAIPSTKVSLERIYCCTVCSYKTSYMEDMKLHICGDTSHIIQPGVKHTSIKITDPDLWVQEPNQVYICFVCHFKTSNIKVIKSHVCPVKIAPKNLQFAHTEESNLQGAAAQNSEIYWCSVCSYKSPDIKDISSHKCTASTVQSVTNVHSSTQEKEHSKIYLCSKCSFQTFDCELMTSHKCNLCTDSSHEGEQPIYLCAVCSFTTPDVNVVSTHICPTHKENGNNEAQPDKNSQTTNYGIIFCCALCSYQTSVKADMKMHDCSLRKPDILKQKSSDYLPVYCCTGCPYKSTNIEGLKTHKCVPDKAASLETKSKYMYCCMNCPYASEVLETVTTHKCPCSNKLKSFTNSNNKEAEETSDQTTAKYSCLACSFTTENISVANAHKCRKASTNKMTNVSCQKFICEICKHGGFSNDSDLFSHIMKHFPIMQVCGLCKSEHNCAEDLSTHYKTLHPKRDPDECKVLYKCVYCKPFMEDTLVKKHFRKHLAKHLTLFNENFDAFFKQIQYPPLVLRTYQARQLKCCFCKKEVYAHGLKCVNSECENMFHISCWNIYGTQLSPHEISDIPDWLCFSCNEQEVSDRRSASESVEIIKFCLNAIDQPLLEELEDQRLMMSKIQEIKNEKQATKEEFGRIKDFIMNAKSERINSPVIRRVIGIIESFINAGVDDITV